MKDNEENHYFKNPLIKKITSKIVKEKKKKKKFQKWLRKKIIKMIVVLIIVGALGTVSDTLTKKLEVDQRNNRDCHMTALYKKLKKTARILRILNSSSAVVVNETCCHLISSYNRCKNSMSAKK